MAISDQLTLLNNTKQAIKTSINNKGGSVTDSTPFADYSTAIDNLPSGGDDSTLRDLIERDITSITIPSGTTRIGDSTFRNCSSLTSVTIPDSVTTIGDSTFQYCSSLASVTIPDSVTSIGPRVFQSCSSLASVTIPDNITSIGDSLFQGCSKLSSVNIPSGVTSIGMSAFAGCSALTSVNIPSGVTSIGMNAFVYCNKLTSVTVNATTPPALVTNAFNDTNNCPVYVPAEALDTYKTASIWSSLASRIYPITQLATVDGNPVYNYEIGNTDATTITDVELAKMPAGTSVEFAEGLTNITAGEINYQEVTLPSTFTGFGDSNQIGSSVTTITSNAVTPPSAFRNQLGGSGLTGINVPASSVDAYKENATWSSFASIIQAIPAE